jgi:hypothetical protein
VLEGQTGELVMSKFNQSCAWWFAARWRAYATWMVLAAASKRTLDGDIPEEWKAQHILLKERLKEAGASGDAEIDEFVSKYDLNA